MTGEADIAFQEDDWSTGIPTKPCNRGISFQIELAAIQPVLEALERDGHPLLRLAAEHWCKTVDVTKCRKGCQAGKSFGYRTLT